MCFLLLVSSEGPVKRPREETEVIVPETKKPRLEEPPPSNVLEEALSDISDDPDEILNRDDTVNFFFYFL